MVSPLLSLMKNQVAKLRRLHVPVVAFTSETASYEKQEIVQDLQSTAPRTRLLYVSPEKFCQGELNRLLGVLYSNCALNRLVVDEAHCISEWGHDFRAEYRRLGSFRARFPDVPIMALTATATPTVQEDILRSLKMSPERLFRALHPFNRANLYYEVAILVLPPCIRSCGLLTNTIVLHSPLRRFDTYHRRTRMRMWSRCTSTSRTCTAGGSARHLELYIAGRRCDAMNCRIS